MKIRRLPADQRDQLKNDSENGRHIPTILLEKVSHLTHISYKDDLRRYASKYGSASFSELEDEYDDVYGFCYTLIKRTQGEPLAGALETTKNLELVMQSQDLEDHYRDHFIHSVQDFFLGSVILDYFYPQFRGWYSRELCSSPEKSVEMAWLLASVFHDQRRSVENKKWLGEEPGMHMPVSFDDDEEFLTNLSSLYDCLQRGKKLHRWRYGAHTDYHRGLRTVLGEFYKKQNHGVLSAMSLINRVKRNFDGKVPAHCAVAALAISTHNGKPRKALTAEGIFPLKIDRFPISCLLMICDAMQEWGRPHAYSDDDTRLSAIQLSSNRVHCEVAFVSTKSAVAKMKECDSVRRCIKSPKIGFSVSARVGLAM